MSQAATEPFPAQSPSTTVEWEAISLRHFVNRYIRTRSRPVNDKNRAAVQASIEQYHGRFPAKSTELERFLDRAFRIDRSPFGAQATVVGRAAV